MLRTNNSYIINIMICKYPINLNDIQQFNNQEDAINYILKLAQQSDDHDTTMYNLPAHIFRANRSHTKDIVALADDNVELKKQCDQLLMQRNTSGKHAMPSNSDNVR